MAEIASSSSTRARPRWVWGRRMQRGQRLAGHTALYLLLIALAIIFSYPLIWMITTSFKPEGYAFEYPPRLYAGTFQWQNYTEAWSQFPFWQSLGNTLTIMIGTLVGRMLSASLTAYALARLRAPGRNLLFMVVLSTMMIPYQVTLIPQFILFRKLRWLDSMKPLIWPHWFGGGAYFIFLLRQFYMTIPRDYDDAARMDGCGSFGIFFRIILPLSAPAMGVVAIYTFMGCWNDVFAPLVYLSAREKQTLAVAILHWRRWGAATAGFNPPKYVEIMAMSAVLTIPPTIVFFLTQRYFVQGIVITGIKG